jgi:hypothetical protein
MMWPDSFGKTSAIVAGVTAFVTTVLSLVIGLVAHSLVCGLIATFGLTAVGLLVGILLRIEVLGQGKSSDIERLLAKFRRAPCSPLAAWIANDIGEIASVSLKNLDDGQVDVRSRYDVLRKLRFLYNDEEIRTIRTTSYDEMDVWQAKDWWALNYFQLQGEAIGAGKTVERIFIKQASDVANGLNRVLGDQQTIGVATYTVERGRVAGPLTKYNNAVVFLDWADRPVYAMYRTVQEGQHEEVRIHLDGPELTRIADAVLTIKRAAHPAENRNAA